MYRIVFSALVLLTVLFAEMHVENRAMEKSPVTAKVAPLSEKVAQKEMSVSPKSATVPTKAVREPLSERELDQLLAKSPWPKELHVAVKRVAFCESSWTPTAHNPKGGDGLMQVLYSRHTKKVDALQHLYDPHVNLRVAHAIWSEAKRGKWKHGFAPWFMSNKCHGLVPPKVAASIKKFKAQKAELAMRNF